MALHFAITKISPSFLTPSSYQLLRHMRRLSFAVYSMLSFSPTFAAFSDYSLRHAPAFRAVFASLAISIFEIICFSCFSLDISFQLVSSNRILLSERLAIISSFSSARLLMFSSLSFLDTELE